MKYLGALLKDARQKKGWSLDEAHRLTKIPKEILVNIEEDRISTLNPAYLKGYLKIYSKYLRLDSASILEGYRDILPKEEKIIGPAKTSFEKRTKPLILFPRFSRFNPSISFKVLVALILVLSSVVFIRYIVKKRQISSSTAAAKLSSTNKRQDTAPKTKNTLAQGQKKASLKTYDNIELVIQAKESTYLQVKIDNNFVFRGTLRRGQTENWQAKDKIELSIGSAGSVNLEVNGRLLPPLGKRGQPIKNMLISRDGSIQIK